MAAPLLLDLFCGAGGAAAGYARAGYRVIGVDVAPQPHYPFEFVQADALGLDVAFLRRADLIHASPPCQRYSVASLCRPDLLDSYPDLIGPTRRLLMASGRPYIIENVPLAPLCGWSVLLCGLMFGVKVFRHRRFESSLMLFSPEHPAHRGRRIGMDGYVTVAGGGNSGLRETVGGKRVRRRPEDGVAAWRSAMGIDWMTRDSLSQAIPPAYTEYLGRAALPLLSGSSAHPPAGRLIRRQVGLSAGRKGG
jgi:DNA (cytosine-5)-methyltransferase 1